MKAIGIKINTYIRESNVINTNEIERLALRFIFWSFGVLAILYVVLLGNMVQNIVARKNSEMAAQNLSNDVSTLELQYLSLSNNIDLNLSHSLGFQEAKPTFATRRYVGLMSTDSAKANQNDL